MLSTLHQFKHCVPGKAQCTLRHNATCRITSALNALFLTLFWNFQNFIVFHPLCLPCIQILKVDMNHFICFPQALQLFHCNIALSKKGEPLYQLERDAHYLLNCFNINLIHLFQIYKMAENNVVVQNVKFYEFNKNTFQLGIVHNKILKKVFVRHHTKVHQN